MTLGALALLAVHIVLKYAPTIGGGAWPKEGGLDPVALALVVCAAVPAIAPHLTSAKLPGGIEVAFREVQRRQELNEAAIAQLRFIVDGFLTRDEYQHLLNIRANTTYRVEKHEAGPLDAELRRMRALGLIENRLSSGIRDFVAADRQGRAIGDWFRLTPRGLEYLAMRDQNRLAILGPDPTGKPGGTHPSDLIH